MSVASTSRAPARRARKQCEEDRRGQVVGKVARDAQVRPRERQQIELENILPDEADVRGEPRHESGRHVAIDLDGGEVRDPWRQANGQRARARADLQKVVGGLRVDLLYQPIGPGGFEEMLTESLLGLHDHTSSSDSPRQYFSSISSICSSFMPK